jgi:hypothetical protein
MRSGLQRAASRRQATRFAQAALHVYGPKAPDGGTDRPIILVTQWRLSDLDAFFDHYQRLGVRDFVFYSAHAPTEALDRIKQHSGTIIVENGLRVPAPEDHVLAHLAQTFAQNCWCLCVKTDELLEFEGGSAIGLGRLTTYLNAHQATAAKAHCLHMFPKGPLGQLNNSDLAQKVASSVYYDMPTGHPADRGDAGKIPATRTPLVFNGPGVTINSSMTAADGVVLSKVTVVIKSYTKAAELAAHAPDATLFSLNARKWNRVELLVRSGLVSSSPQYAAWIKEHSK